VEYSRREPERFYSTSTEVDFAFNGVQAKIIYMTLTQNNTRGVD
jgi:hypothetical protein